MADFSSGLDRLTDEELVELTAQGDSAALAELYHRHAPAAYSLALNIVGRTRAEDAVLDVFLSLWRCAAHYDPDRSPARSWLLGNVRRRILEVLSKLDADEHQRIEEQRTQERFDAPLPTDETAARAAESRPAREALAALPPDQREVLELAYYGGLSQAQIAERLDLPLATIHDRSRLGLRTLRARLEAAPKAPE